MAVLVVEDEWMVRDTISEFLRDEGCTVLEAASGEEAMEIIESSEPIDVIFTDIRLGGDVNGWDVGEAARKKDPDVGLIYTSGHTINPPRRASESLFFDKPWRPRDILAACHQVAPAR